jgi:hypothetical protein
MDIFGDKNYEELDWLTKTVEPITYSVNDKLSTMPRIMVFNIEDIRNIIGIYDLSLEGNSAFKHMLMSNGIRLTNEEIDEIRPCYKLVADGEDVRINFETGKVSGGEIRMEKIKECWTEDELKLKLGVKGGKQLVHGLDHGKCSLERINEILDLMGDNIGTRKRTVKSKISDLISTHEKIMKDNLWNIRNVDLSNKVGLWIQQYLEDGNLAAMTNFCKLKAITHRGYPIYAIEEEL